MDTLKSKSNTQKGADRGRRSFMWKAGATVSAVLAASVPGIARAKTNNDKNLQTEIDSLSNQVEMLEDENAIHSLHKTYENYLDYGNYREVVDLFTEDAVVVFNGGIFKGKNKGIHRLFCDYFSAGSTGKRMEPAPGFELKDDQQNDYVEISKNGRSARARFTYSMQVGTPIMSDSQLVKMAHLQGEGIMKWWEGGTCEVSCVKDTREGKWKIKGIEYRALSRADYRPGRKYAGSIDIPPFSRTYPEEPAGPDKLVKKG